MLRTSLTKSSLDWLCTMTIITFRINTTLLFNSTEDTVQEVSEQVLRTDAMRTGATWAYLSYYLTFPDFDAVPAEAQVVWTDELRSCAEFLETLRIPVSTWGHDEPMCHRTTLIHTTFPGFDAVPAEAQVEWTDVLRSYADFEETLRIPVPTWGHHTPI